MAHLFVKEQMAKNSTIADYWNTPQHQCEEGYLDADRRQITINDAKQGSQSKLLYEINRPTIVACLLVLQSCINIEKNK